MEELSGIVVTAITSSVGTAGLIAGLAWLFRVWISERLKSGLKHHYDHQLEQLKAELKEQGESNLTLLKSEVDRQAEQLRIAASSFSEVQKATIVRKIEAVDALWVGVLTARKAFPSIIVLTDALTRSEIMNLYAGEMRGELLGLKFGMVTEFFGDLAKYRPFLGEVVWAHFATYHALLSRIVYLFIQGKTDQTKMVWYEDEAIKRLVRSVFGEEKSESFELLSNSRLTWMHGQFDSMLLQSIDHLLSGKAFGAESLAHAQHTLGILSSKAT